MNRIGRFAGLAALALTLAACAGIRTNQGYIYNQEMSASIAPGTDNRESVIATMGEPTFRGQFGNEDWYYVSRRTSQLAFRQPRLTDTRVIRIGFDQYGNVATVEETGEEKVASIDPVGAETPTLGREKSFFEELFGNIGQVGQPGLIPQQQN